MVAKSTSFGHGSLVCGLWMAGGGRGGSVSTYVLGTFYICFLCTRAAICGKFVKPTVRTHNMILRITFLHLTVKLVHKKMSSRLSHAMSRYSAHM
jgi:hypothetical protein